MPYGEPDHTDPMTLHGVAVETDDATCVQEMAACFIEEYLRCDLDTEEIMRLFRSSEYAAAHMAYRAIGEEGLRGLLEEALLRRGPGSRGAGATGRAGCMSLPVLTRSEIERLQAEQA